MFEDAASVYNQIKIGFQNLSVKKQSRTDLFIFNHNNLKDNVNNIALNYWSGVY